MIRNDYSASTVFVSENGVFDALDAFDYDGLVREGLDPAGAVSAPVLRPCADSPLL